MFNQIKNLWISHKRKAPKKNFIAAKLFNLKFSVLSRCFVHSSFKCSLFTEWKYNRVSSPRVTNARHAMQHSSSALLSSPFTGVVSVSCFSLNFLLVFLCMFFIFNLLKSLLHSPAQGKWRLKRRLFPRRARWKYLLTVYEMNFSYKRTLVRLLIFRRRGGSHFLTV